MRLKGLISGLNRCDVCQFYSADNLRVFILDDLSFERKTARDADRRSKQRNLTDEENSLAVGGGTLLFTFGVSADGAGPTCRAPDQKLVITGGGAFVAPGPRTLVRVQLASGGLVHLAQPACVLYPLRLEPRHLTRWLCSMRISASMLHAV